MKVSAITEKGKKMDDREKLIEAIADFLKYLPWGQVSSHTAEELADCLLTEGVIIPVPCKECRYYKSEGSYCGFWGECRHPEHYCGEGDREDNG